MGIVMRWPTRRADTAQPGPTHPFWYKTPEGFLVSNGLGVSGADMALKVSALWRALFILSNAGVASLPCIVYRRLPDGGRQRDPRMPMYDLLHDTPNSWMTAPEYWDFVMRALVLRGNACSLIVPGPRGPVDQLIPMHPDRVRVVELDNYRIGYIYRPTPTAPPVTYSQDEVFHLRVFSDGGGRVGRSLLQFAAEDLGHALTLAGFGRRMFERAPLLGGVLEYPGELDDTAFDRMRRSFAEAHTGPEKWHSVAVLEQGTKFNKIGMTNEDAQFLASREFTIRDVARWTGVKKYLLESEDTPNYASIEAFQIEHVTYGIRPWCKVIEQGIKRDLILQPQTYYAEFLLDDLLRGDPLRRAQTLEIQRRAGAINANEWREAENRNRRSDPQGDEYWGQPNLARASATTGRSETTEAEAGRAARSTRAYTIALASADRVVRRETAALTKVGQRFAQDPAGFQAAVDEFYSTHAPFVAQAMGLSADEAQRYCTGQRGRVEREGLAGLDAWAHDGPTQLAQLALSLEEAV